MKVRIEDIKVKKRIREELGDLSTLEQSIKTYGLLNPIIINQHYELLAGARRLYACKNIGWREIDIKVVRTETDLIKLEIESHENLMRKDFTEHEVNKVIELKRKLLRKGVFITIARFFKKLFIEVGRFFVKLFGKKQPSPL